MRGRDLLDAMEYIDDALVDEATQPVKMLADEATQSVKMLADEATQPVETLQNETQPDETLPGEAALPDEMLTSSHGSSRRLRFFYTAAGLLAAAGLSALAVHTYRHSGHTAAGVQEQPSSEIAAGNVPGQEPAAAADGNAEADTATGAAADESASADTASGAAADESTSADTASGAAADESTEADTASGAAADESAEADTASGTAADESTSADTASGAAADESTEADTADENTKQQAKATQEYTVIHGYPQDETGTAYVAVDYALPEKGTFFCTILLENAIGFYDGTDNTASRENGLPYAYAVCINVFGDAVRDDGAASGENYMLLSLSEDGRDKLKTEYRRLLELGYHVSLAENDDSVILTGTLTKEEIDSFKPLPEYGYIFQFENEE